MKAFFYGLVVGAAGAFLWASHAPFANAALASMLHWRDSARSSVYGYGGAPGSRR